MTIASGATLGGVGTVGSISATGGTVIPGNPAPGILTDAGDLGLAAAGSTNSTFTVVLDGPDPGSGTGKYSQVKAGGAINLSGVALSATLGADFVPSAGTQFTIIDNTGSGSVSGQFNNQPEQSVVLISGGLNTNIPFLISYVGGTAPDSNNVVLTELDKSQTAVTFTPASPVFGQSVTLSATVSGPTGSPPPTGTVQFFNGTTPLGSVLLPTTGPAMLNVTTLPVGADSITAQYAGDSNFGGSTSPAVTVTVGQSSRFPQCPQSR